MDKRAIGIFDSGAGGLTALKVVREILPDEDVVYFGDTKNVPYGEKSREDVIKLAHLNIEFLKSKDVKVILAACGTVSSQLERIKCDIPVFGIVESACKKAVSATKNGKISVLATTTTINSGIYRKTCMKQSEEVEVSEYACPKLATLIENGHTSVDDKELVEALSEYLGGVNASEADTLVLGCTHYAIVESAIRRILRNKDISLVDTGREAVYALKDFICRNDMQSGNNGKSAGVRYFISGDRGKFAKIASDFLMLDIEGEIFDI